MSFPYFPCSSHCYVFFLLFFPCFYISQMLIFHTVDSTISSSGHYISLELRKDKARCSQELLEVTVSRDTCESTKSCSHEVGSQSQFWTILHHVSRSRQVFCSFFSLQQEIEHAHPSKTQQSVEEADSNPSCCCPCHCSLGSQLEGSTIHRPQPCSSWGAVC